MQVGELFYKLGFKLDLTDVKSAENSLKKVEKQSLSIGKGLSIGFAAAGASALGIFASISKASSSAIEIAEMALKTNRSLADVQQKRGLNVLIDKSDLSAMANFRREFRRLQMDIANVMIKALKPLANTLSNVFSQIREFFKTAEFNSMLSEAGILINKISTHLLNFSHRAMNAFGFVLDKLFQLNDFIKGNLTATIAAFGILLKKSPMFRMFAGLQLAIDLINDLSNSFEHNGKKTFFNWVFRQGGIGKAILRLKKPLRDLREAFRPLTELATGKLKDLFNWFTDDKALDSFKFSIEAIANALASIINNLTTLAGFAASTAEKGLQQTFRDYYSEDKTGGTLFKAEQKLVNGFLDLLDIGAKNIKEPVKNNLIEGGRLPPALQNKLRGDETSFNPNFNFNVIVDKNMRFLGMQDYNGRFAQVNGRLALG